MCEPAFINDTRKENFGGYEWRILIDNHLSGPENMSRDRLLLEWAFSDTHAQPVLRFFLWEPPAVSVGYGQSTGEINLLKCKELGIDVVRRPTGGRAIFHHTEFTYSITLPPAHPLSRMSVLETYNELNSALALGLRNLGLDTKLSRGIPGTAGKNPSCFSSTSRYELLVNRKKLVGSAQRRRKGAVLQQGSIMVGPQYMQLADLVLQDGESVKRELESHSAYIQSIIGKIPPYKEFVEAMIEGFAKAF